jgi:hypothetical protein
MSWIDIVILVEEEEEAARKVEEEEAYDVVVNKFISSSLFGKEAITVVIIGGIETLALV